MKKARRLGKMLILFVLLDHSRSYAQLRPETLRFSVASETTSLPSFRLLKRPVHPAFNVGADFRVKSGKHWQKSLGADVYYYYHRLAEHAIMLDASYRLGYRFNFGLQVNLLTALGYKHTILPGDKYELKDGEYQKARHFGKPMANVKMGLGLEYPLSEKYSVTTDYKVMLAAPSGNIYIPFALNNFFGAGLKIKLENN